MRILLVEDSELVQRTIMRLIKMVQPHAITDVVDNAPEAIAHLDKFAYDYIVSDFDLRIGTGGDVLLYVRDHFGFYVDRDRFVLMSGELRPEITSLDHPITLDKADVARKLRELLAESPRP
jgi:CheY-like chemotaxis protein